jgi:dTDP-4-dehydrorhamnose reductase
MKRILITGSTGMLGSELVTLFQGSDGFETYGLSSSQNPKLGTNQFVVDLANPQGIKSLGFIPDIIIHTAALTDLALCEREPALAKRINAEASGIIASHSDSKTLVFYISTDSVFDGRKGNYAESDTPNPVNVYAKTKLEGEEELRKKCKGKSIVVRTNIYGVHHPMKNSLCEWAYQSWLANKSISGFADTVFNAVYTGQLSHILKTLIHTPNLPDTINIGSGEAISKFDFLELFRKKLKIEGAKLTKAVSTDFPSAIQRPKNTSLDTSLLSTYLKVPDYDQGLTLWLRDITKLSEAIKVD